VIDLRAQSRVAFILLFFVILVLPSCDQTINYPAPTLTSISPTSISAGQPQFVLQVKGKNLVQQTQVIWTTSTGSVPIFQSIFVSTNELDVTVPSSLIQNPGTANISVTTPTPGGGTSPSSTQPPVVFTINPISSPTPQITSITPTAVTAAAGSVTIFVNGKNFVSQSTVAINNNNRTTGFQNSTQLQATVTSSDLAQPGTLQVTVTNPAPGGGTSNAVSLAVNTPIPVLSSISPISVVAGNTISTTLAATGSGFITGYTTITLNGVPLTTSVANATTATSLLTPAQMLQGGDEKVVIVNSGPGGGQSDPLAFSVNPRPLQGLPVLVDMGANAVQATNGICGGVTACGNNTFGLTVPTAAPSTSSTGSWVAFASASHNLVLSDTNPSTDIYLRNTCLQTATSATDCSPATTVVSTDPNGNAANGGSSEPSISTSGTTPGFAAFTSTASNLTTSVAISGGHRQVFWRPLCTSTTAASCAANSTTFVTQLVSVAADGLTEGNGESYNPVVSADGQYVAFVSTATNLVSSVNADGTTPQVYIRSMCNGATPSSSCAATTYLVSTADGVTPGNQPSSHPSISDEGLFVSFTSSATNLGATAPNPSAASEVFERSTCVTSLSSTTNTCAPLTFLISTPDGTTPADGASSQSSISYTTASTSTSGVPYNGRFVAFASTATNLVPGAGPQQEIYIRDTCTGISSSSIVTTCTPSTILVSTADGTTPGNGLSEHPSISGAAEFVAFSSQSSNFASTTNGVENIFVRNTCLAVDVTCTTGLAISSIPAGTNASPSQGASYVPSISSNGQTVSFLSFSNNLVANDTNGFEDIFLGTTTYTTIIVTGDKTSPSASEKTESKTESSPEPGDLQAKVR
jgi:WD40-like Beta Propeller Repeat